MSLREEAIEQEFNIEINRSHDGMYNLYFNGEWIMSTETYNNIVRASTRLVDEYENLHASDLDMIVDYLRNNSLYSVLSKHRVRWLYYDFSDTRYDVFWKNPDEEIIQEFIEYLDDYWI